MGDYPAPFDPERPGEGAWVSRGSDASGGRIMRIINGLAGLALAASITGAGALTAVAAPPDGGTTASTAAVVDELPNAAEEKRRALREVALKQVISGKAKPTKRGASTVVKLD